MKRNNKERFLWCVISIVVIISGCGSVEDTNTRSIGGNNDVYEFASKVAPHMHCVYVDGYSNGGLSCFPKELSE